MNYVISEAIGFWLEWNIDLVQVRLKLLIKAETNVRLVGKVFSQLFAVFQDPEVMNAFMDVQKDPSNISKYEDNPKVQKVLEKLATKFGGAAGGDFGV